MVLDICRLWEEATNPKDCIILGITDIVQGFYMVNF